MRTRPQVRLRRWQRAGLCGVDGAVAPSGRLPRPARSVLHTRLLAVSTPALRHTGGGKDGAEPSGVAASDESTAVTLGASQNRAPGGLAVYNEDEDNLPPLKYEEGPVGAPSPFGSRPFWNRPPLTDRGV